MPILTDATQFCNFYWSHPYWKTAGIKDPWIRVRCLPSAGLIKKDPYKEVVEGTIRRSKLGKALSGQLTGLNDKGYDIYYFVNRVPALLRGFAKDSDVTSILWFPHDFDFHLGISLEDLYDEFGFTPGIWVETSRREGVSRYQTLLGIDVEDGAKIERCRELIGEYLWAFGADPTAKNASRILRMPGFINWKGDGSDLARVVQVEGVSGVGSATGTAGATCETWAAEEIGEYVERFSETKTSGDLRSLALGAADPLRQRSVRTGNNARDDHYDGERNNFGDYQTAYEKAERGEVSAPAGARHRALCSWAGQMARKGVTPQGIVATMRFLAEKACEGGYDEKRDLESLIRYARELSQKEKNEVGDSFEVVAPAAPGDELSEDKHGEREENETTDKDDSDGEYGDQENNGDEDDSSRENTGREMDGDVGDGEKGANRDVENRETGEAGARDESVGYISPGSSQRKQDYTEENKAKARASENEGGAAQGSPQEDPTQKEKTQGTSLRASDDPLKSQEAHQGAQGAPARPAQPERPARPERDERTRPSFSLEIAGRMPHETEQQYLTFLATVCKWADFARNKVRGNHEPLAATLFKRMELLSMIRNRGISVPVWEGHRHGRSEKQTLRPEALDKDQITAFAGELLCGVSIAIRRHRKKLLECKAMKDEISRNPKLVPDFAAKGELLTGFLRHLLWKITLHRAEIKQPSNIIVFQNGVFCLGGEFEWGGDRMQGGDFACDSEKQWFEQARWLLPHPVACWFTGEAAVNGSVEQRWKVPEAPEFSRYLEDTFPGESNAATRDCLLPRIVGYVMNCGNPWQKFFAFIGAAGAGKGVMCELLEGVVGGWNGGRTRYASLADPWGFGTFEGKTLMIAEEAENADHAVHEDVMGAIKSYTGSDRFSLRKMHKDERTVETTAKIVVTANKDFPVTDASGALQRRLVCIWFGQMRPVEEQIDNLGRRLYEDEGDQISSLGAVALWRGWSERAALFNVRGSEALAEGKKELEGMIAPVLGFCREVLRKAPGENLSAGVLACIVKILRDEEKIGNFSGLIEKNIKSSMSQLGYRHIKTNSGHVYANCRIDVAALLAWSELGLETFSIKFMAESRAVRLAAKDALGLDYEDLDGSIDADKWNV